MRLCIPVSSAAGLESIIEPRLHDAQHLVFFDTETRDHLHLDLQGPAPADESAWRMDAVLCGSIHRMALHALLSQGIQVYGTDAVSVAEAIGAFERGELAAAEMPQGGCHGHGGGCCSGSGHAGADAEGGCGGGCGGHDHGAAHRSGGCGGHGESHRSGGCGGHGEHRGGCGGHGHHHDGAHGGGCCSQRSASAAAPVLERPGESFRVAVCSQNRKTVTEHAGKCRKFWIYEIAQGAIAGRTLVELAQEQSLHETSQDEAHPIDGVAFLISAGMGDGLRNRLAERGIVGLVVDETDPDVAVAALLRQFA